MSPTVLLLLQLLVILGTARICGGLLRALGQPAVIGEMAAGLVLGPIVLGRILPGVHAQLFAAHTLGPLTSLSTLGLVVFMFLVGAELRSPQGVLAQLRAAGAVGVLGMIVPMGLALFIAPWLHPTLAPAGVRFWPFALFLASSLSITAFPVMARILKDRGLTQTRLGRLSLSAAAVSDVLAWIILALVVALVGSGEGYLGFVKTAVGAVILSALLFGAGRPLVASLLARHAPEGSLPPGALAGLLVGMLGTALCTELVGLHAVFGAFLFGAALPRDDRLLAGLTNRLESLAVVLLMPIVFALAGLGTTAAAFTGPSLGALGLLLAAAVVGKVVGGTAGARLAGLGWRESLGVGSLMNARGLMELIVMKVGLDAGLIGKELFTILLVMALVTTLMTGPLLLLLAGEGSPAPDAGLAPKNGGPGD